MVRLISLASMFAPGALVVNARARITTPEPAPTDPGRNKFPLSFEARGWLH